MKRREDRWPSAAAFREALVAAWVQHRIEGLERGARFTKGMVDDPT
jgi:hypothetical protein